MRQGSRFLDKPFFLDTLFFLDTPFLDALFLDAPFLDAPFQTHVRFAKLPTRWEIRRRPGWELRQICGCVGKSARRCAADPAIRPHDGKFDARIRECYVKNAVVWANPLGTCGPIPQFAHTMGKTVPQPAASWNENAVVWAYSHVGRGWTPQNAHTMGKTVRNRPRAGTKTRLCGQISTSGWLDLTIVRAFPHVAWAKPLISRAI